MLASMYEMKDELNLIFEAYRKQDLLLSNKSKKFYLMLANLIDIFKALNLLNLVLNRKNMTLYQ